MAYEFVRFDRVVFMRWLSTPTVEDAASLLVDVARARAEAGAQLVAFGLLDAEMPLPPPPVRDYMVREWKNLIAHTDGTIFLVRGSGVRTTLIRTFVRGMIVVARVRGVTITDDLRDAMSRVRGFGVSNETVRRLEEEVRRVAPLAGRAAAL